MSNKYVDALAQSQHEKRRWFVMVLVMGAIAGVCLFGWLTARREITVHLPPDLRTGATLTLGAVPQVPDTTVYTFAIYIWQQINRWEADGVKDYGRQIYTMQSFVTPACREQLVADMNARNAAGELARRTRAVMEINGLGYAPERVKVEGGNAWKVLLDTQIQETQAGVPIKEAYIRYPLRIVRFDVDREKNPWQLAIDCFGGERPARLDARAVAVAKSGHMLAVVNADPKTDPTTYARALDAAAAAPPTVTTAIAPATLPTPAR
jgi:integrating conjugative element protein (TIGR03746 family)